MVGRITKNGFVRVKSTTSVTGEYTYRMVHIDNLSEDKRQEAIEDDLREQRGAQGAQKEFEPKEVRTSLKPYEREILNRAMKGNTRHGRTKTWEKQMRAKEKKHLKDPRSVSDDPRIGTKVPALHSRPTPDTPFEHKILCDDRAKRQPEVREVTPEDLEFAEGDPTLALKFARYRFRITERFKESKVVRDMELFKAELQKTRNELARMKAKYEP